MSPLKISTGRVKEFINIHLLMTKSIGNPHFIDTISISRKKSAFSPEQRWTRKISLQWEIAAYFNRQHRISWLDSNSTINELKTSTTSNERFKIISPCGRRGRKSLQTFFYGCLIRGVSLKYQKKRFRWIWSF